MKKGAKYAVICSDSRNEPYVLEKHYEEVLPEKYRWVGELTIGQSVVVSGSCRIKRLR